MALISSLPFIFFSYLLVLLRLLFFVSLLFFSSLSLQLRPSVTLALLVLMLTCLVSYHACHAELGMPPSFLPLSSVILAVPERVNHPQARLHVKIARLVAMQISQVRLVVNGCVAGAFYLCTQFDFSPLV
jgi:hypothetical protein